MGGFVFFVIFALIIAAFFSEKIRDLSLFLSIIAAAVAALMY